MAAKTFHDSETFLTRAEAANYLRCSVPTLHRWAQHGTGPQFRIIGGRALYALADLREFAGVEVEPQDHDGGGQPDAPAAA